MLTAPQAQLVIIICNSCIPAAPPQIHRASFNKLPSAQGKHSLHYLRTLLTVGSDLRTKQKQSEFQKTVISDIAGCYGDQAEELTDAHCVPRLSEFLLLFPPDQNPNVVCGLDFFLFSGLGPLQHVNSLSVQGGAAL